LGDFAKLKKTHGNASKSCTAEYRRTRPDVQGGPIKSKPLSLNRIKTPIKARFFY